MIGVDKIGDIRRAYFEQQRPIKEIVRTLSVSRATVRKVIRGKQTEFRYERGVQPTPKLGDWVEVLTEILKKEGVRGRFTTGSRNRRRPGSFPTPSCATSSARGRKISISSPSMATRWNPCSHLAIAY